MTATPSTPAAWTPDIPAAEAEFERCTGEPVWRWLVRWASEFAVGGLDLYRIAAVTATLLYRCFPRRPGPAIRREDELDIHAAAAHTVLAVARHETRDRRWVALADALLGDPGFDAFCAWLDGPFRRVQRAYLEARTNLNAHARAAKSSQQRQQALRWLEDDLLRECPGPDEQAVIDMLLPFDCAGTGHRPPSAPNGLAAAVRKAAKLCGTGDPVQNREDLRQLLVRRLLAGVSGRPPAAALEGDDLAGAPERQDAWMRHLMVGDDGRVVVSDLALRNAALKEVAGKRKSPRGGRSGYDAPDSLSADGAEQDRAAAADRRLIRQPELPPEERVRILRERVYVAQAWRILVDRQRSDELRRCLEAAREYLTESEGRSRREVAAAYGVTEHQLRHAERKVLDEIPVILRRLRA